jgi:hypothetical protein
MKNLIVLLLLILSSHLLLAQEKTLINSEIESGGYGAFFTKIGQINNATGVFVLEPGLDLILNINKNFRLAAGVEYRYVSGVSYESLSSSDLSGISGQIVLKIGVF